MLTRLRPACPCHAPRHQVGVDHHFVQSGAENSAQVLQGADPNHFAPEYFAVRVRRVCAPIC